MICQPIVFAQYGILYARQYLLLQGMDYLRLVLILGLVWAVVPQGCVNHVGAVVDWWVILKVPPKIGSTGFGYYDSTYRSPTFQYIPNHVDQGATALTMTMLQINTMSMETVAWNDEKPNNQTSFNLAHSKGFISYSFADKKGFLLSHSLPKYPAFNNHKVNITIATGENYYGQHLMCATMSVSELNKLAYRLMITRPFIYESTIKNSSQTNYLADLAAGRADRVSSLFQTEEFDPSPTFKLRSIYKNGYQNCSIFEDGLIGYLKMNVTAQTWGRPLEAAWCSRGWTVNNVLKVMVGSISWDEQDDHSKWAMVGNSYSCFGDMNRMSSQWKRGGSFFCFDSPSLALALQKTIVSQDRCK